jgi:lipopolysaccharide export system protein LptA
MARYPCPARRGCHRLVTALLTLAALGTTVPAVALKSDRDQPIVVDADESELDFQTGLRIYRGNVSVRQGTMLIRGDKLELRYKDETLLDATAYGKPATFRQRPDGQAEEVHGQARRIVLDDITDKVHLYDNAVVIQGQNTVKSNVVHYDMNSSKVLIKGGPGKTKGAGTAGGSGGRARVIIRPKGSAK